MLLHFLHDQIVYILLIKSVGRMVMVLYFTILLQEIRKTVLVRRGSDGSLLQPRSENTQRHIKIFVS